MNRIAFSLPGGEGTWTGGINYLRSLVHAVSRVAAGSVDMSVYVGRRIDITRLDMPPSTQIRRTALFDARSLPWWIDELARRSLGRLPLLTRRMVADGIAVHSHGLPGRQSPLRTIGWIPDFQHVHLPQLFSTHERGLRDRHFHALARHSDRVILSSDDARRDFETFAPQAACKARVLRFAALPQDHRSLSRADVEHTYGIDRPYFYVPNQFWVHKNHQCLIDALKIAAARESRLLVVCSGSPQDPRRPGHFEHLQRQIAEAGLATNLLFLGLVPYPHIAPLMHHAIALVNPSLFEGWSTTVEEAKALGVPRILSSLAVHVEQCGIDADYFPPDDPEALAALLLRQWQRNDGPRSEPHTSMALVEHDRKVIAFGSGYLKLVSELLG